MTKQVSQLIRQGGQSYIPSHSTGQVGQRYIPSYSNKESTAPSTETESSSNKSAKEVEVAVTTYHLPVSVSKTFTPSQAKLPETGAKNSPAFLMMAIFTAFLGFFGLKKKEEN